MALATLGSVAIGHRDQLLGFRSAGQGHRTGECGRIGVADVICTGVPGQASIARRVRPVDPGRQPAVGGAGISAFRARTQQQGEKDKSSSHEEPRSQRAERGEG